MAQPPAAPGNHIERIDHQTSYNSNTSQSINNTTYTDVETVTNNSNSNNETNNISGKGTQITNSGEGDFTGDVDASSNNTINEKDKDRPLPPLPLSRYSDVLQMECFRSYTCDVNIIGMKNARLFEVLGPHYVTFNFGRRDYIRINANECETNMALNKYSKNKWFRAHYEDGRCDNLSVEFIWLTERGDRWGHVALLPKFGVQLDPMVRYLCNNGFQLTNDTRFAATDSNEIFKWFGYTGVYDKGGVKCSLPLAPDESEQAFPIAGGKPIQPWVAGFLQNGNKDGNNNNNDNDNKEDSGKGVSLDEIEHNINSNENSNARHGSHGGGRVQIPKRGSSLLEPNRKPPRWHNRNGANHSRDKRGPKTSKAKQEQRDSPLGNGKKGKSFKKTGKPKSKSKGKSKSKSKNESANVNGAMSGAESSAKSESDTNTLTDVNEEEEED